MKTTTRTYAGARTSDISEQWQLAIRGDGRARDELLKRIMPARRGR
jgi:hypothetical protein